jgi:CDP-diacylglycerol--glycerol-3-phosphate 3-phosphatidyltransferase
MKMNVPNKITAGRLLLAVVFFVLVSYDDRTTLLWADVVFVVACATDFLDGYFARRLNQVTAFGRIADPFCDKVIVCGGFVLMAGRSDFIQPWMVVLLISREFLVSSIRGHAESQGIAFGAEMAGKVKAVVQMIALGVAVWFKAYQSLPFLPETLSRCLCHTAVYLALVLTVLSAITYIRKAQKAFAPSEGEDADAPS